MPCPFCGAVFNLGLNAGAGALAGAWANHIRARHPKEALIVSFFGGAFLIWLWKRL